MRVVVGVDGSKGSRTALEWALNEARLHHADLTAITAWSPTVGVTGYIPSPAPFLDPQLLEDAAHEVVDHALEDVDCSGVDVHTKVVAGGAAHALIAESQDADLVVVGSRGRGGFAGLLLGSVSQQVAEHARCPVVIVPTHA
ncbi:MAG TPA: universal stress protein [Acidimicrobiales bacterium]|nr:universal stress protein [Acidimicrobiales bacterium]